MVYMPDIGSRMLTGCVSSLFDSEILPCMPAVEDVGTFSAVLPCWAIMSAGNARWIRMTDVTWFLCVLLGIGRRGADVYRYAF
jgi:hypothetical protein